VTLCDFRLYRAPGEDELVVVLPGPVRRQVGVVGRRGVGHWPGGGGAGGDGHDGGGCDIGGGGGGGGGPGKCVHCAAPGTPWVQVAEVIGEGLQGVGRQVTVVPQHLARWPGEQVTTYHGNHVSKTGDELSRHLMYRGQVSRWAGEQVSRWAGEQVSRW